jgi:hypothetical protein
MRGRIEKIFSRILSEKYNAKIKIKFKEKNDGNRTNR